MGVALFIGLMILFALALYLGQRFKGKYKSYVTPTKADEDSIRGDRGPAH